MLSGNNPSVYPARNATLRKIQNVFSGSNSTIFTNNNNSGVAHRESDANQVQQQQKQDFAFGLYSVVLSDSIRSLETLSPGLYHWIHSGDFSPRGYLRFYTPSGLLIKDSLPKHLTEPYVPESFSSARAHVLSLEEQMGFNVSPIGSRAANPADNMRKQARKPVMATSLTPAKTASSAPPPEVKRFFLNVMELEFNKTIPNCDQVICIVTMSKQKRTTSCLPLGKSPNASKSSATSAICMESFVFDVPNGQGDIIISILIYSKSQDQLSYRPGGMVSSPSLSSLSSTTSNATNNGPVMSSISFLSSTLKRSGTVNSVNHISHFDRERVQAEAGDIGIFLADLTVVVPSAHAFGKIDSWHPLTTNKKNIGRVQLQMGLYSDYNYVPMPEVPSLFSENLDTLNFSLLTRGGLIWDKKWVQANPEGLFVYSAEHRTEKAAMAWIPFKKIIAVSRAQYQDVAWPNTLCLSITLPWQEEDKSVFSPSPLSSRWKDQVVEAGVLAKDAAVVDVYVAAETEAKRNRWQEFLTCHINRHHRRYL